MKLRLKNLGSWWTLLFISAEHFSKAILLPEASFGTRRKASQIINRDNMASATLKSNVCWWEFVVRVRPGIVVIEMQERWGWNRSFVILTHVQHIIITLACISVVHSISQVDWCSLVLCSAQRLATCKKYVGHGPADCFVSVPTQILPGPDCFPIHTWLASSEISGASLGCWNREVNNRPDAHQRLTYYIPQP